MKKYTEYTIEELKEMTREVNGYDGSLNYLEFYYMEELDELLHSLEPSEIARMLQNSDFNINHDYFVIDYDEITSYTKKEVNKEIKEYAEEITEAYFDLVESGNIEDII